MGRISCKTFTWLILIVELINKVLISNKQQASLRVWDEEKGQDLSSRRDTQVKPKKVIIYSSQLTDAAHIEQFLQKDRCIFHQ